MACAEEQSETHVEDTAQETVSGCHGDALWASIEAHLAKNSAKEMMEQFTTAQANKRYKDWLAKVLEDQGYDVLGLFHNNSNPLINIPEGDEAVDGTLSLAAFPPDHSREQALRAVGFLELKEKMQAIVLAQEWRSWDVLQISREPGTTGLDGTFLEDFHIRLCALGALFYLF